MQLIRQAGLYFHTLRHLRCQQLAWRLWYRLYRPRPDDSPAPPQRVSDGHWSVPAARAASMGEPSSFRFLNQTGTVRVAGDWNDPEREILWLYNLHYFDDLNAEGAADRVEWHRALMQRWIDDNPPASGAGWAPYPLSLRIVNWIKWALAGNTLDQAAQQSLALQVRYLRKRLEYHLLGNHLFANAKALVFAGCYFDGEEADSWLRKGIAILAREIPEQILADGGQFERSPMYHALAYEDMLDLVNLASNYPAVFGPWNETRTTWRTVIERMGRWLACLCHPDGEIAFFNDAAMGVAPSPGELFNYAQRLGQAIPKPEPVMTWLKDSGYIRVVTGEAVLLIDVAPVGPDYLPGHAHADTLSFELSVGGQRVIVNSGTSRYGLGIERERERATAAHNTVEIDGQDSSQVWAGFRVARRARPFDLNVEKTDEVVMIEAAHDGYRRLPGRPVHRRRWVLGKDSLEVLDHVEGDFSEAMSRLHFHPAVKLDIAGKQGKVAWSDGQLRWQVDGAEVCSESSDWHPEFGISLPARCLALHIDKISQQPVCRLRLEWN